jgi:hypothetical protein
MAPVAGLGAVTDAADALTATADAVTTHRRCVRVVREVDGLPGRPV